MKFNTKPKCIYIKNIYMQPSKNHKLNNSTNYLSKNAKNISDYNVNNKGLNNIQKQINKTSIKSFYQNIYPKKEKYLVKGNPNYLSSKIINNKIASKYEQKHISTGKIYEPSISKRKIIHKNYEIHNPFKERSNSENSLNCFNRTYSFFNKNEDNISKIKKKPGNIINIYKKDNEKINISCTNINKKYNYRNYIKNNEKNYNSSKNSNKSSINLKENKKYFYQEPNYKNCIKQDTNVDNSIIYSTLQKDYNYNYLMSPIISDNIINNNINISSITNPISDKDDLNDIINYKKNKGIKKYIISDKKKKIDSRQNNKEISNPLWKSTAIKDEIENGKKNYNNTNFDSKIIEKIQSIQENDKLPTFKNLNFYSLKENNNFNNNNNFENILDTSNYFDSTPLLDSYCKELQSNEKNIIKEKDLFEQSAIIIQSIFRGFLAKSKFETLLYNYNDYNKANEILEELIHSYFKKDIMYEKQYFIKYLKEIVNTQKLFNKENINYKSCKIFKNYNIPFSLETEVPMVRNRYIDLFLHKEIGERFNILNEKINREKEIEKKYKEEIDGITDKMNKLIEENKILKDLNQKNKLKEAKYKEISIENKKKDIIINIITNDNQNLAKKLKIIKEKYNKLEIKNEINVIIRLNEDNKITPNIISNELYLDYRNIYMLYLFNKKNHSREDILRKKFHRYKEEIISIKKNNILKNKLREEKIKNIISNKKNEGNKIIYATLVKMYYNHLLKNKDIQNINNIRKGKIFNLFKIKEKTNKFFIKSYFTKFYNQGLISQLIEEKNEMIKKKEIEKINKFKKIISVENHKNKYNILKLKNCFNKWFLMSKMLAMKAITDEKKRKKRQKQRTKKKIEKNKSANKYLSNSNSNKNMSIEKKYINIFTKEKEKEKEKDIVNYLEHSLTTEISGGEINIDSKTDKIVKATEKLSDLFLKASLYYKIVDNKKNDMNLNKENINQNSEKNNNINRDMNNNDNDNDEDSGESSFGI